MANLAVWLLALVGPLVKKALVALGIGWVSYQGIDLAVSAIRDQIIAHWGALSADIASFLAFAGFGQAFGIVLSALAARAALMLVQHLGKVAS